MNLHDCSFVLLCALLSYFFLILVLPFPHPQSRVASRVIRPGLPLLFFHPLTHSLTPVCQVSRIMFFMYYFCIRCKAFAAPSV